METLVQQLATLKQSLLESLQILQDRLADLPEDVPNFDHATITKALEASRQIISDADPAAPERWAEICPVLEATHKLVLEVGPILTVYSR